MLRWCGGRDHPSIPRCLSDRSIARPAPRQHVSLTSNPPTLSDAITICQCLFQCVGCVIPETTHAMLEAVAFRHPIDAPLEVPFKLTSIPSPHHPNRHGGSKRRHRDTCQYRTPNHFSVPMHLWLN